MYMSGMFPPEQVNPMIMTPNASMGLGPMPYNASTKSQGFMFGRGSGCGGTAVPCSIPDIPPQARERKERPLPCSVQRKKVDADVPRYTSLATLPETQDGAIPQESYDLSSNDDNFDTITLAFGTKPGSNKPPKMLVTLKTPKVLSANLCVNETGTQVTQKDIENEMHQGKGRHSATSKKSSGSRKSKKSKGKKGSVKKGGKKQKGK